MQIEALFKITYGIYVVSSVKNGKLNGQIANSVFQVTAKPPMVAISINKNNLTHEFITESGVFSISVLTRDTPMTFIGKFGFKSGRDIDKFKDTRYKIGVTGAPLVLDYSIACIEAKLIQSIDCGTHTTFIGEVVNAEITGKGEPMTYDYYHAIKGGKSPKNAPTYVEKIQEKEGGGKLKKYRCKVCGYVYDPEKGDPDNGIEPGMPFEKLPDNWVCPICGAGKEEFEEI